VIIGIDLGSARVGVVAARSSLPLHIAAACEIQVNPRKVPLHRLDLGPVVEEIISCVGAAAPVTEVVIEHGLFYAPTGKSPAALAAMAQAHEVCSRLEERLRLALAGVYKVTTVCRETWSHRAVPHTRGTITDAMAWEGLLTHIAEGEALLDTQDERDAAGVLLAVLLPPPKKRRAARVAQPRPKPTADEVAARQAAYREREAARVPHTRGRLSAAERRAAGCTCKTKPRADCPIDHETGGPDPLDVLLGLA
jgi:hypothetical protein